MTPGDHVPAPVPVAVEGRPELAEAAVRPEGGAVSGALPAVGTEHLSMQEVQTQGLHPGQGAFCQDGTCPHARPGPPRAVRGTCIPGQLVGRVSSGAGSAPLTPSPPHLMF